MQVFSVCFYLNKRHLTFSKSGNVFVFWTGAFGPGINLGVCFYKDMCIAKSVLNVYGTDLHNPPSDAGVEIFLKRPHNSKYCLK